MNRITVASRAELKHDMDYLKAQAAFRNGGNLDRQDRRAFKLNLKHEKKYEEAKQQEYEEEGKLKSQLGADGQLICTEAKP